MIVMTTALAGFVLGLAGSLHCAGMCGPLALFARRPGHAPFFVYHASRIGVYLVLGGVAGWTGAAIAGAGWRSGLATAAGLVLIGQALGFPRRWRSAWRGRLTSAIAARLATLSCAMPRQGVARSAVIGVLNGLLPCGLLYAALAAAAGLGRSGAAVAFMAAFGIGSLPAFAALTYSAHAVAPRVPRRLRQAAPIALAAVGLLLIVRGWPVTGHAGSADPAGHRRVSPPATVVRSP